MYRGRKKTMLMRLLVRCCIVALAVAVAQVVVPQYMSANHCITFERDSKDTSRGVLRWSGWSREIRVVFPTEEVANGWGIPSKATIPASWRTESIRSSLGRIDLVGMGGVVAEMADYERTVAAGSVVSSECGGWPLRCWEWHDWRYGNRRAIVGAVAYGNRERGVIGPGIGYVQLATGDLLIPINVLWSSFLLNIVCVTAIIVTTVMFVSAGYRRAVYLVRRSRGQCYICAYDLRGIVVEKCPECGSDIA